MPKNNSIVIDTNIWVSYFIQSRFTEIAVLIQENDLTVYSDVNLINEIREVLGRKKFKKYIVSIEKCIEFVELITDFVIIKKEFKSSPDPKDNFLFDLALQTKSKVLVTGDRKLLNFEVEGLEVISSLQFKEKFK